MYKIKLEKFEGPLDLLLFFVRKDELNIYDIPIAHITKSYLEYLKMMQDLNLDIASEFILMAATLMRIKVRCMLPPEPGQENEEEPLDPREELTRRLIEYRQFKDASRNLSDLDDQWRMIYRRNYFDTDRLPPSEEPMGLKNISFFDLLAAYKKAISKTTEVVYHNVERLNVTVEEQIEYITTFFSTRNGALFSELCEGMCKIEIVVTFLALLDMIRREALFVRQSSVFDDIWIQTDRPDDYDAMLPEKISNDAQTADSTIPEELSTSGEATAPAETAEFELSGPVNDVTESVDTEETELIPDEPIILNEQTLPENLSDNLIDISALTDQLKSSDAESLPSLTEADEQDLDSGKSEQDALSPDNPEQWIDEIQDSLQVETNSEPGVAGQQQDMHITAADNGTEIDQVSSQPPSDSIIFQTDDAPAEFINDNLSDKDTCRIEIKEYTDHHDIQPPDSMNGEYNPDDSFENAEQDFTGISSVSAMESFKSDTLKTEETPYNGEISDEFESSDQDLAETGVSDNEIEETHTVDLSHESKMEEALTAEYLPDSKSEPANELPVSGNILTDEVDQDNNISRQINTDLDIPEMNKPSVTPDAVHDSHAAGLSDSEDEYSKNDKIDEPQVIHLEIKPAQDAGITGHVPTSERQENLKMTGDNAEQDSTTSTSDEKEQSTDKDHAEKPSVLRKIFTSVISFVKKFFKR